MSFGNHIIHLNDTKEMPLLGLGTYKTTDDNQLKQEILEAFSCGYHLIDTASFYKNEEGIGKSIKALSIPRSELFITTKLWNTAQRIGNIEDSFIAVWSVWDWNIWICILSIGLCPAASATLGMS